MFFLRSLVEKDSREMGWWMEGIEVKIVFVFF